jgi:hypothetical protein
MSTTRLPLRMKASLAALLLAAAACDNPASSGGGTPSPTPQQPQQPQQPTQPASVASVEVAPDSVTLVAQGGHRMLQATVRLTTGEVATGRLISWTSSNPAVAVVDASGNVTAITAGEVVITARIEGKQSEARVRVLPLTVDSVAFSSPWYRVEWDTEKALYPTLYAADGRVLPLWDVRTVAWSSSDPSVATVSGGLVKAVRGGRAWITATVEGRSARTEIIVPDSKVMTLAQAGGRALPAAVVDSVQVRGDSLVRVRVVATQGTFTFDTRYGWYEQRVTLVTYERRGSGVGGNQIWELSERLVKQETVMDYGMVRRNQYTGEPIFDSGVLEGWTYYAQNAANNGYTVWQALPGTGINLDWLYRL